MITTHLAFTEEGHLAGYVSLACSCIDTSQALRERQGLRRVPYASLPALLVTHFAIQVQFQSRGTSGEAMSWIWDLASGLPAGCRFLMLHVASDNTRAVQFYSRQGFVVLGQPDARGNLLMLHDVVA